MIIYICAIVACTRSVSSQSVSHASTLSVLLLHLHVAGVQHLQDGLQGLRSVLHEAALEAAAVDLRQRQAQPVGRQHVRVAEGEVVEERPQRTWASNKS